MTDRHALEYATALAERHKVRAGKEPQEAPAHLSASYALGNIALEMQSRDISPDYIRGMVNDLRNQARALEVLADDMDAGLHKP